MMATPKLSRQQPDYLDPPSRKPLLLGIEIPLAVLMSGFVLSRAYTRFDKRTYGYDDLTMVVAWLLATSTIILHCVSTHWGVGLHVQDVPKPEINGPLILKISFACQILLGPCIGFTKISICLSYLRLFPFRANNIFCYCTMTFVLGVALSILIGQIFQCSPVSHNWEFFNPHKNCFDQRAFAIATAVLNNATDFLVFLWPAKYIRNVQLPATRRVALLLSFTVGIFVCVAGAVRIWNLVVFFNTTDSSWVGSVTYIVTAVEISLGIVCGCIPPTRPLFSRILARVGIGSHKDSSVTKSSGARNFVPTRRFNRSDEDGEGSSAEIALTEGIGIRRDIDVSFQGTGESIGPHPERDGVR